MADEVLPPDLLARVKASVCRHCGGSHARACPRVKRLAFHANGSIAEVEFWAAGKWPTEHIIWPDELPGDDE